MPNNLVYEQERLDELHRNGYFIIQDPKRFCFGMDAVLLSGFAKAKKGERAKPGNKHYRKLKTLALMDCHNAHHIVILACVLRQC